MNLQSFCARAGLAVAAAGVVGYAALATLLPAPVPASARPPAAFAQAEPVAPPPAATLPTSRVEAPASLPVMILPATPVAAPPVVAPPVVAPPPVPVRTEPPRAGFAAHAQASGPVPPPSHSGHHAAAPRPTKPPRAAATSAGARANAEHARPLGRAIRAEAAPAVPATQVSYKVPGGSRRWSYRRVY